MSLGEESVVKRVDVASLYENQTKAGQFVAADGTVRQAGIVEGEGSEHTIDATHRDRAIQTLNGITNSLTMSLGEESVVKRVDVASLYENQTKAGQFVAADGTVRQAGIVEGEGSDFKI
jgi:acyl-CoA synthetase (NDP forming)